MKTIRNTFVLVTSLSAAGLVACSTALPPQDLVTARNVYDRASRGPAAQLDPADLHTAQEQLAIAEASFSEEGDSQNTRDQAYLAVRKTELAESVARAKQSKEDKDGVVNAMHADEKRAVAATSAELGRSKQQLAVQSVAMNAQGAALNDERSRRQEAEKRAAQAAADLAKFATVKQSPRGMVITLSGSILFTTAKWDLLPSAQVKLNDVATALIKEDPLSKMVVEGYTDSQGGAAYNQDLSMHRAQAVRDYLVTRGIASDRITAQGFGLTNPIGDNKSAEGRANNRRVEIVVQSTDSTRATTSSL
jgi:outer membrane protein OmpA-like peptidoglycan-associated protein